MPKIFISYRRADSQYIADRIYDSMSTHFDEESASQDMGKYAIFTKYIYLS